MTRHIETTGVNRINVELCFDIIFFNHTTCIKQSVQCTYNNSYFTNDDACIGEVYGCNIKICITTFRLSNKFVSQWLLILIMINTVYQITRILTSTCYESNNTQVLFTTFKFDQFKLTQLVFKPFSDLSKTSSLLLTHSEKNVICIIVSDLRVQNSPD